MKDKRDQSKEISVSRFETVEPSYNWYIPVGPAFLTQRRRRRKWDLRQQIERSCRVEKPSLFRGGIEVGAFGAILATFMSSLWLLG